MLVKVFVVEPLSDRAVALLAHLALPGVQIHVPDLLYFEVSNILWKCVSRARVSRDDARSILSAVHALNLISHRAEELTPHALNIALDQHITAYDAGYVALSELLDMTLVTADDQLVAALSGTTYKVQSLATFSNPPL
ncbi:MAG: type II toxin-antitoxin system VapC family toxin [Chloroflexi bacterium]|nr:type II toxin-antitoxin system VapC family toxin [Chloroflexota bacterium]